MANNRIKAKTRKRIRKADPKLIKKFSDDLHDKIKSITKANDEEETEDTILEAIKEDLRLGNGIFGDDGVDDEDDDDDDYVSQSQTFEISFIELAILNAFLYACYKGNNKAIAIDAYGQIDAAGRIAYGGGFEITGSFWFRGKFKDIDNEFMFQTKIHTDNRNNLVTQLVITSKDGINYSEFEKTQKKLLSIGFNNSEYKGKVIKVKLRDGSFKGLEIIDTQQAKNKLILNKIQTKFITHFIDRIGRGGNARYLFNGEPGSGKTEAIRWISRQLMPKITFIIPVFANSDDLTSILEACEIFDNGVIIMDDIDLYLGSRDNGSYTKLLGEFLSFFDGVKKRKISLLASTNDKGLVDKAAERPGRFNMTIDFGYLEDTQIIEVCNVHLAKKWQIQDVYETLIGNINGKKAKITGAFIANLAENIKEMSEGITGWTIDDTIDLIKESYRGFYNSQIDRDRKSSGFDIPKN